MALRFDAATLPQTTVTTQGFRRITASVAKTGVLKYRQPDGTVRRELRLPEEVFAPESLATLLGAPVTLRHCVGLVNPDNVRAARVGGQIGEVRQDGDCVVTQLQIEDSDALSQIDEKKLQEISPGYNCKLEWKAGIWKGEPYDCIQRQIVYNHFGLGPKAWGRAGADLRLHLDSLRLDSHEDIAFGEELCDIPQEGPKGRRMAIKLGNVEIKLDERDEQIVRAEIEGRDAEIARLKTETGKLQGEKTALQSRFDAADARIKQFDRAELEGAARKVLGAETKFDGKTDEQVRTDVITKVFPSMRLDGADEAYARGLFDAAVAQGAAAKSKPKEAPKHKDLTPPPHLDGGADEKSERQKMIERRQSAWKGAGK